MRNRRGGAATCAMVMVVVLVASCAPPPGAGGPTTIATPTPPTIVSFGVRGNVGAAPATVALGWSVTDPNGDLMTCELDADGDGDVDSVVHGCTTGVYVVSVPTAGPVTARLSVSDTTPGNTVVAERTFVVGPDPVEPFDIDLRGVEALDADAATAFTDAARRWESAIVRGTASYVVSPTSNCLATPPPSPVDDLVVDVSVEPIDGPGAVLGFAGPTCVSPTNDLAVTGEMTFDAADVAQLLAAGQFDDVVLHEMGHVLGIGTLWNTSPFGGTRNLTAGIGTTSTRYLGPRALGEYTTLTGISATPSVPLERFGGPGTQDAHWSESVFDEELMTGWIDDGSTPLSRVTLASLADLGLQVDLDAADDFVLPSARAAARSAREPQGDLIVLRPPLRRL